LITRGMPIVLLGGPANYDNGNCWTTGRVVDFLPPDTEVPLVWIYVTWAPWRGDFHRYAYAYSGVDAGAVVLTYRGPMPHDRYADVYIPTSEAL
jgi:hypothetical protein